jgi:predicted PurR-regulated permease PerM
METGRSPRRLDLRWWLAFWLFVVLAWLTLQHIEVLLEVVGALFVALLLSLAIRPLAERLSRRGIPRPVTVLGIYAIVVGILAGLLFLLSPVVSTEISLLRAQGPHLTQSILSRVYTISWLRPILPTSDTLTQLIIPRLTMLLPRVWGVATTAGDVALDLLVVVVLGYFFTTESGMWSRMIRYWVPEPYVKGTQQLASDMGYRLSRWAWAQAAIALYFGVVYSIGLSLLGVPFAVTIGLVGGVLEVVPYLGGAIGLILASLSALSVDPLLVLWVVLFHVVVAEVESHILAPAFYGHVTGLHPAALLVALFLGLKLAGIIGVFLAVPIAVVLLTLLDTLRQRATDPGAVDEPPAEGGKINSGTARPILPWAALHWLRRRKR